MEVATRLKGDEELLALKIAREIALNLYDTETILEHHKVSAEQWTRLQANPYFVKLLTQAIADWNSALNTNERVKLKSAALYEEWLPEANTLAHDRSQPLNARVELMKLIKSTAGVGLDPKIGDGGGERFSVTINLGGGDKLTFEKDITSKVIEHEPSKE